jgi:hypothetical protein
MEADGSDKRKVSTSALRRPDFSPDGGRLAFEVVEYGGHAAFEPGARYPATHVGTIDVDGRRLWRETWYDERIWHAEPIWAPDGRRLMTRFGRIGWDWTLAVMTPGDDAGADGATQVSPGSEPGGYGNADWAPGR